ncbi:MAG: RagB/SusD family nutrient uptake outer membrane protein [Acidobacterium ailaaui]|nr:RagB/SusD family nutrient uptake outer membrane protein [Pseudacidobacterium ailaaui]
MKRDIKYIVLFSGLISILTSCHKLDVTANSEYTASVFPKTEAQFQSIIGPIYIQLRSAYSVDYWFIQELSTDEAILPAYGGNWYDGNKYQELHRHTWTQDNAWVNSAYSYAEQLVGLCNQTLYILKDAEESSSKDKSVAEVKTIRAFAFWMLMDLYGNVPLDTTYPSTGLHTNASRTEVFNYIESELKAVIPYLSTNVDQSTYGKPTRYMAFALLAKMYLNSEVYTGTPRYNECIAVCDSIISSGKYALEPRATYLQMFYPDNGPQYREFIFVIPYDPSTSSGYMYHARYDLNRNLGIKYRYAGSKPGNNVDPIINGTTGNGLVNNKPSGPRATLSSFLNYFLKDTNDIRLKQWLYGPQYWDDGNPIMVQTTKKGYNQFYTGSDGGDTYIYHLVIDTSIQLRLNPTLFDCGNDEIAWNQGARNIKFYPDANSTTRNQNNDVPVFRYSDIILMKAEAILRGGNPSMGQTALSLVNMVRSNRTTSPAWASVTLEDLYEERCREFTWECWHRNDMIRFGKYEDTYGFKTNADTYRRIFPIPTTAMQANPKLKQNPGY